MASSRHGEPRSTQDVDILVELSSSTLDRLMAALRDRGFYVPEDSARRAVEHASSFNALHLDEHFKVDFFVARDEPLHRAQLADQNETDLLGPDQPGVVIASAEATVVAKLDWYVRGGSVSDQQWRDVQGILRTCQGLDVRWMQEIAAPMDLTALLERALAEAGLTDSR
ncbi:MAG: hypothetical protein ACYTG2_15800 [Planctomycetota bacterium]